VLIRKKILDDSSLRYENFVHAEDYALWARIMDRCKVANIPEVLVRYRSHEDQIVNKYSDIKKQSANNIRAVQLNRIGIEPSANEISIHERISTWDRFPDAEMISEAGQWLEKLYESNRVKKVYQENVFNMLLAERWFWVCNSSTVFGMIVWKVYWKSPISNVTSVSWLKKFKFLLKCIMRY
jgi:hypothetical protein